MILAPLLYAARIVRPTEVVAVLGFFEPKLLTRRFAGFAAFGSGTISLMPPVAMVGREETPATRAFALSHSLRH
jgi:hypothetical protein